MLKFYNGESVGVIGLGVGEEERKANCQRAFVRLLPKYLKKELASGLSLAHAAHFTIAACLRIEQPTHLWLPLEGDLPVMDHFLGHSDEAKVRARNTWLVLFELTNQNRYWSITDTVSHNTCKNTIL